MENAITRWVQSTALMRSDVEALLADPALEQTPAAMDEAHVEVIAGINLPILVKLASVRSELPLADAVACAREAGRMRSEGKAYRVQDGDVLHFLFNA